MKLITVLLVLIPALAFAADVPLSWDASEGATGYKVYRSADNGATWDEGIDVANVTEYTAVVPDGGLILFRVSAYNAVDEYIRYWSGAWYNVDWEPINSPGGTGIE